MQKSDNLFKSLDSIESITNFTKVIRKKALKLLLKPNKQEPRNDFYLRGPD